MTERKTPAKKAPAKAEAKPDAPKHDEAAQVEPRVNEPVEVTQHSGGDEHSVNPPLAQVEEYQSVGVDPEFLAEQTVEPDFDKAEAERAQGADRAYLDSRTRNRL